jgi:hypothetical protein
MKAKLFQFVGAIFVLLSIGSVVYFFISISNKTELGKHFWYYQYFSVYMGSITALSGAIGVSLILMGMWQSKSLNKPSTNI